MIPLLLLALGLGLGLSAYELSPKTHSWVDDHVSALHDAFAAHRQAEAHMVASTTAPDARTAVWYAIAAQAANQAAAQVTAIAAQTAKTPEQRAAAADSANAVLKRGATITAMLTNLGTGVCGVKTYAGVTVEIRDTLIAKLRADGMVVTGTNPWNIDTHRHDVKLKAAWDPISQTLALIVSDWGFVAKVAGCEAVWNEIEPTLRKIIGS